MKTKEVYVIEYKIKNYYARKVFELHEKDKAMKFAKDNHGKVSITTSYYDGKNWLIGCD